MGGSVALRAPLWALLGLCASTGAFQVSSAPQSQTQRRDAPLTVSHLAPDVLFVAGAAVTAAGGALFYQQTAPAARAWVPPAEAAVLAATVLAAVAAPELTVEPKAAAPEPKAAPPPPAPPPPAFKAAAPARVVTAPTKACFSGCGFSAMKWPAPPLKAAVPAPRKAAARFERAAWSGSTAEPDKGAGPMRRRGDGPRPGPGTWGFVAARETGGRKTGPQYTGARSIGPDRPGPDRPGSKTGLETGNYSRTLLPRRRHAAFCRSIFASATRKALPPTAADLAADKRLQVAKVLLKLKRAPPPPMERVAWSGGAFDSPSRKVLPRKGRVRAALAGLKKGLFKRGGRKVAAPATAAAPAAAAELVTAATGARMGSIAGWRAACDAIGVVSYSDFGLRA
mmetsp:Transcript_6123/g.21734  ORF Transcript_6123/g.21734 Transcript_6123/m.21734 type:complete len:396 (+) Transcript_6123:51-1238(+)